MRSGNSRRIIARGLIAGLSTILGLTLPCSTAAGQEAPRTFQTADDAACLSTAAGIDRHVDLAGEDGFINHAAQIVVARNSSRVHLAV